MPTLDSPLHRPIFAEASAPNRLLPGVLVAGVIAGVAMLAQHLSGLAVLSPLILAIVAGLVVGNTVGVPARTEPGIGFAQKTLLRLGIVLLGLRITQAEVFDLGGTVLVIVAASLFATFVFTRYMGQLLRVPPALTTLIAAGTSVCGASAVVAANSVARADDEDVAYAMACVTILGSLTLFIFPLIAGALGMDARAFGVWSGASVHEVAQVAAVAFQHSDAAGEIGTVAKLFRVVLLAPLILMLSVGLRRGGDSSAQPAAFPWFVFGFFALVCLNSAVTLPQAVLQPISFLSTFLMTAALGAMGLNTRLGRLRTKGIRPALLGILGSIFIASFSLVLIQVFAV